METCTGAQQFYKT